MATVNEYLDVLAYGAKNATSDALLCTIALKQQAQLRRLASLHARRQALKRQLGGRS